MKLSQSYDVTMAMPPPGDRKFQFRIITRGHRGIGSLSLTKMSLPAARLYLKVILSHRRMYQNKEHTCSRAKNKSSN